MVKIYISIYNYILSHLFTRISCIRKYAILIMNIYLRIYLNILYIKGKATHINKPPMGSASVLRKFIWINILNSVFYCTGRAYFLHTATPTSSYMEGCPAAIVVYLGLMEKRYQQSFQPFVCLFFSYLNSSGWGI